MIPLPGALNSPFVSGGLLLMLTGGVMATLRNLPGQVWLKVKNQCMISVTIKDNDPLFEWVTLWLHEHPYTKKARHIAATTNSDDNKALPKIIFSPAKGEHFFFYQGRLIWLSRDKEDSGKSPETSKVTTSANPFSKNTEEYTIRTLSRAQAQIRNLLNDVLTATKKEREEKTSVYVCSFSYWDKIMSYTPRPLASVFLPKGQKESIVEDMRAFMGDREWYMKRGVPYRRGYLFYGPPGNGKTSIISALAGELGLNLYSLSLSGRSMDDSSLSSMLRNVRSNSLVLLEDVDAATHSREHAKSKKNTTADTEGDDLGSNLKEEGVTLSGLLNALDGVVSPEGLIVVMTTNYKNRLDPALIRPGRVDVPVEFKHSNRDQRLSSFQWFYPERGLEEAEKFADSLSNKTSMATVQQKLILMR